MLNKKPSSSANRIERVKAPNDRADEPGYIYDVRDQSRFFRFYELLTFFFAVAEHTLHNDF